MKDLKKDDLLSVIEKLHSRISELENMKTRQIKAEEELKAANLQIRKIEENLKNFFNSNFDFLWVLDETGNIITINDTVKQRLGYNENELIGKSILFVYPEEYRDNAAKIITAMLKGKQNSCPIPIMAKDGSKISVETYIAKGAWNGKPAFFGTSKDISALKLSEEKFAKAFHCGPAIKGLSDILTGEYYEVNQTFYDKLGFTPKEVIGKKAKDILRLDDDFRTNTLTRLLKQGFIQNEETVIYPKNGTPINVLLSGEIIEIQDKKYNFTTAIDITGLKKAEEYLKESEDKFRFLSAATFEGIVVHKKGIVVDANQSFLKMTGYSKEEVIGENLLDYIPKAKDKAKILINITKQITKPYTITAKHKSGKTFIVELESKNVNHNGKKLRIVAVRDVTQKIKVEEERRISEERFRKLIEHMPSGVAIYSPIDNGNNFKFLEVNKAAEIITNSTKNDLIGYSLLEKFPNMGKSPLVKGLKKVNTTGKDLHIPPFYYKDSVREGWRENYIYKLQSGEIVAIFTDVSERLNAQQKLKNQNIDLKIAKEKAEESDRLKSAFLANMSHEIRTPMNGILGFADLLREPEISGQEQEKYVDIIEDSGKRMLNIINDLIDISKVEAGQMEVNISETNINEQIEYLYTFFKPEVENKGMKLSFSNTLTKNEAIIETDKEKVYAILTNLIKNAIKYSNKGNIEFGYNLKKDSVPVEMEFYVKDTGIGIPENRQQAVFDRFVQADIEDKKAMEGAGLGLSICKAYVEMLGGKIWLESKERTGSQFYFTIPYTPKTNEKPKVPVESLKGEIIKGIKKINILIVEDEEFSDYHLSIILKNISKEVFHACTGNQAVELCQSNQNLDLILMDIKLPLMNGYKATRKIREFNKDVKIIAQTAYALPGDREKALEAGCDDYITKPINKDELIGIIERLLVKDN
ncbi:MAG: PAS domain S-box protein [Bacteroidales bacterium]|nr:PAS domain S-box protein [Bacteroidales bacterium]